MLSITTINNEVQEVTDWVSIKEPIVRMSFKINEKQAIVLEGFESYLRIKEEYQGVNCKIKGISKIFLFGRAGLQTGVVEIDCKKGTVKNYTVPKGDEYYGKLQADPLCCHFGQQNDLTKGYWKRGVVSKPHIYTKKIYPAGSPDSPA